MSYQIALPVDALEPVAGKDAVELLSALRIVADDAPAVTGTEVALVNLAGVLSFKTAAGTFTIASLGSPAFTGTPSAPTAAPGTNTTQIATTAFVQAALAALIDASPGALDTLNELAAALGDDANFATTITNALAGKVATTRSVATQHSLNGGGDLSADRTLSLVNDTASPGNNKVYGTNGSGVRGWKDDPSGGGATDPSVAHVRSDGSDVTGTGAPGAPFATFQAAVDHASTFSYFDFGVGSFGAGDFSARSGAQEIFLFGSGESALGTISHNDALTVVDVGNRSVEITDITTQPTASSAGGAITGYGLLVSMSVVSGGGSGGTPLEHGGNAGNITLVDCEAASLTANGGQGGAGDAMDAGGNGGNGGTITLLRSRVLGSIEAVKGTGGSDGGAGAGVDGVDGAFESKASQHGIPSVGTGSVAYTGSIVDDVFETGGFPGKVIQTVTAADSAQTSTTSTMAAGSAPTTSGGAQVLSASITPKRSDSTLLFMFAGMFAHSAAGGRITVALFNTTASSNAIHSTATIGQGSTANIAASFMHYAAAAATSARTYTVRFGPTASGTAYVNGNGSGNGFGGTESCELIILEIAP